MDGSRRTLTPARLRLALGLLALALALPSAALLWLTWRQLQWESLHQHRSLAEDAVQRLDATLQRAIAVEEARGYADYGFLGVAGDPATSRLLQRSPLAQFPPTSELPGLLGWFQVDAAGAFSSPLVPPDGDAARWGLDTAEFAQRRARHDQLFEILAGNRLVERRRPAAPEPRARTYRDDDGLADAAGQRAVLPAEADAGPPPASAPAYAPAQAAFDRLNIAQETRSALAKTSASKEEVVAPATLGRAEAEGKDDRGRQLAAAPQRAKRIEAAAVPELREQQIGAERDEAMPVVRIFESELDPFEFAQLDSGHFVLFRRAWRDGQRSIQGLLLEPEAYLDGLAAQLHGQQALAAMSMLELRWQGTPLRRLGARAEADAPTDGRILHRARLSAPFAEFEPRWTVRRLPPGPVATLVGWLGAVLFAVLVLGLLALYRLGLRQLRLARQQQDFVSAVSHELKTPLTSIRMYAELLQAGWADAGKTREYYAYIFDESERLSRLIANVLQLARLERDELRLEPKPMRIDTVFDLLRSKVQGQIERAGFVASFRCDPALASGEVAVDADAVVQIVINLVDNALKFSARAERREVELNVTAIDAATVGIGVRDWGPGVPAAARRRIFELFYRGGSELTRETSGTGIGLALVRQLAHGMGGEVELLPREPGAEFRLRLRRGPAPARSAL